MTKLRRPNYFYETEGGVLRLYLNGKPHKEVYLSDLHSSPYPNWFMREALKDLKRGLREKTV